MNEVVTREATRESYTGWEIAVDLPYRDVVLAELLKLGPSGNQPCAKLGEAEPLLDLGLITLLQVDATTAKIKDYFGPQASRSRSRSSRRRHHYRWPTAAFQRQPWRLGAADGAEPEH